MCFILLNEEKSRLFFDVLFVHLPYSDPELSRFFLIWRWTTSVYP